MVEYKEAKKSRQTLVLVKDNEVIATFGSLKKAIDYINHIEGLSVSYWTLSRKTFPIDVSTFKIWKVKHY